MSLSGSHPALPNSGTSNGVMGDARTRPSVFSNAPNGSINAPASPMLRSRLLNNHTSGSHALAGSSQASTSKRQTSLVTTPDVISPTSSASLSASPYSPLLADSQTSRLINGSPRSSALLNSSTTHPPNKHSSAASPSPSRPPYHANHLQQAGPTGSAKQYHQLPPPAPPFFTRKSSSPRPASPESIGSSQAYTSISSLSRPVNGSSASVTSSALQPSATASSSSTFSISSSRHPSRRPSLVTLQSFLEGVNHVTRVRSPSLRGHSRRNSFDEGTPNSFAGSIGLPRVDSEGDRPWHLDDVDEVPSWEDQKHMLPNSPTPTRPGLWLRDPSDVSLHKALFTTEREPPSHPTSPLPIHRTQAIDIGGKGDFNDEDDEFAERTFRDTRDLPLFPNHGGYRSNGMEDSTTDLDRDDDMHRRMMEDSTWTEQDLNALVEGDRLGLGLTHEGFPIVDALDMPFDTSASQMMPDDGIQFEIVRQLGYGSYAIVYLVKEVLYDHAEDESAFPAGDNESYSRAQGTVYGREFALKCLSKRNLSEEQMAVQKFEATLHRSLPKHDNVVALHRAMETPIWLFLVLEYCPGQDLYFWLEQARDSEGIDGEPSRAPSRLSNRTTLPASVLRSASLFHNSRPPTTANSPNHSPYGSSTPEPEATPPSPSLLSTTIDSALLSRRRLRLISRMFVQMCEGLQVCHDVGVSHRDIKPENIIIVDDRAKPGSSGKVVIKLTDWGLGTTDDRCEDFDCGSKPYMAYECRNNTSPSYEPKGADVWSLGIVLLNLLFHRCPWSDPTLDDPDFSAFRNTPVKFLETRFPGIGSEVANFLANKVFCDVSSEYHDDMSSDNTPVNGNGFAHAAANERVTAGEFGKWASKLVRWMGEGQRTGSVSDAAVQMVQTLQYSPRLGGSRILHSPQARSPRNSLTLEARHSFQFESSDNSPSRKPARQSGLSNDIVEELEARASEYKPNTSSQLAGDDANGRLQGIINSHEDNEEGGDAANDREEVNTGDNDNDGASREPGESGMSTKPRRRKRGARKGKSSKAAAAAAAGEGDQSEGRDRSATSHAEATTSPDALLVEASHSVQALAREISSKTRPSSNASSPGVQQHPQFDFKPAKSRFSDRFKGAFANGNADLEAFASRAKGRDMALTGGISARNPTASAPAKLQHENAGYSGTGSVSSFGSVASTGSWSEDGRSSHWASTGSRRDRLSKKNVSHHHGHSADEPYASSRPGRLPHQQHGPLLHHQVTSSTSPSPSRQSYTPLSSFSSSTSYEPSSTSPVGIRSSGRPSRSALQAIAEKEKEKAIYDKKDAATSTSSLDASTIRSTGGSMASSLVAPGITVIPDTPVTAALPGSPAPPAAADPPGHSLQMPALTKATSATSTSSLVNVSSSSPSRPGTAEASPAKPAEQPTSSKAKFGRLFGKFSRS